MSETQWYLQDELPHAQVTAAIPGLADSCFPFPSPAPTIHMRSLRRGRMAVPDG